MPLPPLATRREFLQWTSSAAFAAALSRKADAASDDTPGVWRNKRPGMSYRRLGKTDYMISEIICGGNTIAPTNYKHVVEAFDMGLNYFDTAVAYGRGESEKGYAKALKEVGRENVFLTTKVSAWASNRSGKWKEIYSSLSSSEQQRMQTQAREELERRRALEEDHFCNYFGGQQAALEASVLANVVEKAHPGKIDRPKNYKQVVLDSMDESLGRLQTDHVDILMCPHGANSYAEVTAFDEVFEAFETLKKAGKVSHLGVSSHSDPGGVLDGAIDAGQYSVAMIAYNIINHSYVESVLDKAKQHDFGVIAMKVARPVHHGRNNGVPNDPRRAKIVEEWMPGDDFHLAQKCYLWTLQDSRITACNSEMMNAQLVRANLALAGKKA